MDVAQRLLGDHGERAVHTDADAHEREQVGVAAALVDEAYLLAELIEDLYQGVGRVLLQRR